MGRRPWGERAPSGGLHTKAFLHSEAAAAAGVPPAFDIPRREIVNEAAAGAGGTPVVLAGCGSVVGETPLL
ncbi:unnamed protein product [Ectocarpus fasciculatus]